MVAAVSLREFPSPDRFQGKTTIAAAESSPDERLELRVRSYLASRHLSLESVRLDIVHGNVLLRGAIPSATAKWRLCEACRHVAGVMNVVDRLVVTPGLHNDLTRSSRA